MNLQKLILVSVFSLIFTSCQKEEKTTTVNTIKSDNTIALGATGSSQSAVVGQDDFSDLKKEDDESCDTKTAEDIEKELAKKAAEMKKAAAEGKATGFNFNSGEPGCDPNAEGSEQTAKNDH